MISRFRFIKYSAIDKYQINYLLNKKERRYIVKVVPKVLQIKIPCYQQLNRIDY